MLPLCRLQLTYANKNTAAPVASDGQERSLFFSTVLQPLSHNLDPIEASDSFIMHRTK